MASLYREIPLETDAAQAWETLRDSRNIARVFAGVLIDAHVDGDLRTVTFANGSVVQERIVAVDDAHMRVAYTVCGPNFEQHAASMQIVAEAGGRCHLVWISDFLPDERRAMVEPLMDAGCAAAQRNLARQGRLHTQSRAQRRSRFGMRYFSVDR